MASDVTNGGDETLIQHIGLIRSEVSMCHSCWGVWKFLYMEEESFRARDTAGAAEFFRIIRDSILDDVVMTLSRLLDPPRQGSNENLVLSGLVDHLGLEPGITDAKVVGEALEHLDGLRKKVEGVRNKRLAHTDKDVIAKLGTIIRYGVTDTEIDGALEQLRRIMAVVDRSFPRDSPIEYNERIGRDAAARVIELIGCTL